MSGVFNKSNIVKEYEFNKPEINGIDYLLDEIIKDCTTKFFHTFKYRRVYDNKFTKITKKEKGISNISHDCFEIKSE